jgi:hypothetical protein
MNESGLPDVTLLDAYSSTYWRKKDSEKAELFCKIEPYLTFLNVHLLERQGADIQTKVEELEQLNQSMRDRDKMKDDAIAHLSDQLVAITTRLQELERRQMAVQMTLFNCSDTAFEVQSYWASSVR